MSGKQNNFFAQALQQGVSALRARQFAQAEQIAAGILKSNRTDRNAALLLAHALMGQGRGSEAIAPLEKIARRGDDGEVETLLEQRLRERFIRDPQVTVNLMETVSQVITCLLYTSRCV